METKLIEYVEINICDFVNVDCGSLSDHSYLSSFKLSDILPDQKHTLLNTARGKSIHSG